MMTTYHLLASRAGHPDAAALAHELARWHDRMVAHVRRHGGGRPCCGDEACPREDADRLWDAARRVFGAQAMHLTFLSAQARGRAS